MRSHLGELAHLTKPAHIPGAQPEILLGRGGFVKLGHHDKHFIKNSSKKGSAEKNFEVFSLRSS